MYSIQRGQTSLILASEHILNSLYDVEEEAGWGAGGISYKKTGCVLEFSKNTLKKIPESCLVGMAHI